MSTSRPAKHERPASIVSQSSPKRVKEGNQEKESTVQSQMSWEKSKQEEKRRGQKRDNVEVEGSTEAGSLYGDDDDRTVSGSGTASPPPVKTANKKSKGKKASKVARIEGKDSPSKLSGTEKRERQAQLKSAGSSKGKGKRVIDDSEDHEIGEEWTDLNGLRWRMGEDRQVRREAVVVEMRPKYPSMPKDSRHPDAKVKIAVLVERFLTEKEYEEAKAKKLLSFQEMERQREAEDAKEAVRRKQEEEEEARRKRTAETARQVTTPKKIRDLQALFSSAHKPTSPQSRSLPFPISRSGSFSTHSSQPSTPQYTSVKRLSLSMGRDDADSTTSPKPVSKLSTPQPAPTITPLQAKISYRLPLASPTSPGLNKVTVGSIRSSPIIDTKAKRKREEVLLKLLQEEADRRKKRDEIK